MKLLKKLIDQIRRRKLKKFLVVGFMVMILQLCFFCPCTYAAYNELMRVLDTGKNLTVEDIKPIVEANPDFVEETHIEYHDPLCISYSVIYYALFRGENTDENRAAIAQYLIEKGSGENWCLEWFAEHGCVDGVRILLERGFDPNYVFEGGSEPYTLDVRARNDAHVRSLLEAGNPPDQCDENRITPLHFAVRNGNDACVRLLLEKGANPNQRDKYYTTPLHYAIDGGYYDCVKLLLEWGADPTDPDDFRLAVEKHHDACVRLLLKWGADPSKGLLVAAKEGNSDYVRLFLDRGANLSMSDDACTPLHLAAANGHEACVRLLLERGANPNGGSLVGIRTVRTPLEYALKGGHDTCARLLIVEGVNSRPDFEGPGNWDRLLLWAIDRDYPDCVRSILKKGADPNGYVCDGESRYNGEYEDVERHSMHFGPQITPLCLAAERGRDACVRLLLKEGADPNKSHDGSTPLRRAVCGNKVGCVRLLLDAGAEPDQNFDENETLLHYAAKEGLDFCVRQLLEAGADLEKVNKRGETPLQLAKEKNHMNAVQLLKLHGAKEEKSERPNARHYSSDPEKNARNLYMAIETGNLVKVRPLLESGVDPNRGFDGYTPLCLAIETGNIGCVRLLLKKGANPNCIDKKIDFSYTMMTPLCFAAEHGREGCVGLLLKAGANPNLPAECMMRTLLSEARSYQISPLFYAASCDAVPCVRLLLEAGANPNFIGMNGPPLHKAVSRKNLACVKLLLRKGADPNCADIAGRKALDIFDLEPEMIELIRYHGGRKSSDCVIM